MLEISDENVEYGFSHLETIAAIHHGKSAVEYKDAITALAEYFGMDDAAQDTLLARVHTFVPESKASARTWVIIGFLIGMATAQNGLESN
ncbi:MAG: hypothetical protein JWR61_5795 [Ferruginibacter sp.]|uniref:hypothetical protein n=1 Tax=Ferruginibacter sp. TaxID=1940288 RepID=UPI0026587B49|nr:hypothetical protein [Ferruginibacter sp.]MDB5280840.1 hypothetical protein [Ferruginibacter sp.]